MPGPVFIIADDHPMVRAALREPLLRRFADAMLKECERFDQVMTELEQADGEVDLVLLDLNMPGSQGVVGLMTVLAHWPTVAVAVVSGEEQDATIGRVMACGAVGFIPKSSPMGVIEDAVQAILDGATWVPPDRSGLLDGGLAEQDMARRLASLSPQQLRVLQMIMEGKLNKHIAADLDLVEQTVKTHVSAILRKFGVHSRTQIVLAMANLTSELPPEATAR